jgi:hypothetical protein
VIESPLLVRRVAPPTRTMMKTKIESQNNQLFIAGIAAFDLDGLAGAATSPIIGSAISLMFQK